MTSAERSVAETKSGARSSAWAPLGQRAFALLWLATVLSNIGTWMHDVGAGWLMTELSTSPILVAAVQAATTLPVFLFALLAGAIADIVDRRKLLIIVNVLMAAAAAALAFLVSLDRMTPAILLGFTFLLGTGAAFMAPAWQAIVPSLVSRPQLSAAIALNSVGINVSRAIGPALAGFLIVAVGLAAPFALNALSFIGIIAALLWWRPLVEENQTLPSERLGSAIIAGLRFAFNSGPLQATLVRAGAFFLFASALWAMLPLVAREVLQGGPTLYGLLLASIGGGAVAGALLLPFVKPRLGADRTVAAGTLGTALVLVVFAFVKSQSAAIIASALAGACWIAVLSSLHVSAQTSLPNWVRARGLSIFLTVFFGAMSIGSLVWGQVATMASIETSLLAAAVSAILLLVMTWPAKLNQAAEMDLAPSAHWPTPLTTFKSTDARGPVMVQVAYQVEKKHQPEFVALMRDLAKARRRNGGYGWNLMQDATDAKLFMETWFELSWVDHLRHHERVTGVEEQLQERIRKLNEGRKGPIVRHFLATD